MLPFPIRTNPETPHNPYLNRQQPTNSIHSSTVSETTRNENNPRQAQHSTITLPTFIAMYKNHVQSQTSKFPADILLLQDKNLLLKSFILHKSSRSYLTVVYNQVPSPYCFTLIQNFQMKAFSIATSV